MEKSNWVLYGANGYSGKLILEEALKRGHKPIIGGRSEEKIRPLAEKYSLEYCVADPADTTSLRKMLDGKKTVLNAAGPFINTSTPMIKACVGTGVNYLDITGEILVFEKAFVFDKVAKTKGIAIIPGVGFDVVPTDCMASFCAKAIKDPTNLEIGFAGLGTLSPGTVKTFIRGIHHGTLVRKDGKLARLEGRRRHSVLFSDQMRTVMPISWGDLSTAYHSTGIPNITVYTAVSPMVSFGAPIVMPLVGKLLKNSEWLSKTIQNWIDKHVHGPDETVRQRAKSFIWVRAENEKGEAFEATLSSPEPYKLTAIASVRAVEHLFSSSLTGSFTPSQAFGDNFILEMPETARKIVLDSRKRSDDFSLEKAA